MNLQHTATPRALYNLSTGEVKMFPSSSAAKKAMREQPGVWTGVQPEKASPKPDVGLLKRIAYALLRKRI